MLLFWDENIFALLVTVLQAELLVNHFTIEGLWQQFDRISCSRILKEMARQSKFCDHYAVKPPNSRFIDITLQCFFGFETMVSQENRF